MNHFCTFSISTDRYMILQPLYDFSSYFLICKQIMWKNILFIDHLGRVREPPVGPNAVRKSRVRNLIYSAVILMSSLTFLKKNNVPVTLDLRKHFLFVIGSNNFAMNIPLTSMMQRNYDNTSSSICKPY